MFSFRLAVPRCDTRQKPYSLSSEGQEVGEAPGTLQGCAEAAHSGTGEKAQVWATGEFRRVRKQSCKDAAFLFLFASIVPAGGAGISATGAVRPLR